MIPKNRKFNVAGVSYHQASVNVGDEIHFELEPSNPYDSNAVKVLKRNGTVLGHVPKEMSEEVTKFLTGKYPNYSAYVYEIWEMRDGAKHFDVPKIMAHFANQPNELPSKFSSGTTILSNKTCPIDHLLSPSFPISRTS